MQMYRATVMAGRYPTEYTVEATSWGTAANRAIRLWSKRFKGERTTELKLRIVKV